MDVWMYNNRCVLICPDIYIACQELSQRFLPSPFLPIHLSFQFIEQPWSCNYAAANGITVESIAYMWWFCWCLDHAAIPDFSAGAMENWGLVLYRETALLHDDSISSISNKYWVSLVMAHEIAHTVSRLITTCTHTWRRQSLGLGSGDPIDFRMDGRWGTGGRGVSKKMFIS